MSLQKDMLNAVNAACRLYCPRFLRRLSVTATATALFAAIYGIAAPMAVYAQSSLTVVSPDAASFAVVASDSHIEVRGRTAAATSAPLMSIEAPKLPVTAAAFSADGSILAVGSDDRFIRVWNVRTGKRVGELQLPREPKGKIVSHITALAFSPNGTELTAVDGGYGWLVRYRGAGPSSLQYADTSVVGVSLLSLAGDTQGGWVGGDSSGHFYFYDAALRPLGVTPSKVVGAIRSLAVSSNGRYLASGGDDAQIKLWLFGSAATAASNGNVSFQLANRYSLPGTVTNIAFRMDGSAIIGVDSTGGIADWVYAAPPPVVIAAGPPPQAVPAPPPVAEAAPTLPVPAPASTPTPAPVVPQKHIAAKPVVKPVIKTAVKSVGKPAKPVMAAVAAAPRKPLPPPVIAAAPRPHPVVTLVRKLIGHSEYVNAVVFSPDGRLLASGSRDRTVRLWDVSDGTQKALLGKHANFVSAVAFSPDGSRIATGGWDNKILLWDPSAGAEAVDPHLQKHTSYVLSLAYSADGTRIASGSNDLTARIFDLTGAIGSKATAALPNAIAAVAFSPDGTRLAGGSLDGRVYIWDAKTLKPLHVLVASPSRPIYCLTWMDNDTLVTSGKAGLIHAWNARTGKAGATFLADGSDVYGLAYDSVRHLLATGGADRMIHFWAAADVQSGRTVGIKPVADVKGHTDTVRTLAFSKDGNMLASGGWDYNIVLWSVVDGG